MSAVRQTERLDDQQSLAAMSEFSQEHPSKNLSADYDVHQLFDKNTFVKAQEIIIDAPPEEASHEKIATSESEGPGTLSFWKRIAQFASWFMTPGKVSSPLENTPPGEDKEVSQIESGASVKTESLSFWRKIVQFASSFIEPDQFKEQIKMTSSDESSAPGGVDLAAPKEIINPVPELDPPDMSVPIDFGPTVAQQRKLRNRKNEVLTAEQFETAVSLMSNRTIEQIMAIILKAQLVLEQENAEVAATTHDKYNQFRTTNQKLLEEIKDALVKDEKVASYLKTSQYTALCASFICGMAATAISFNALPYLQNTFGGLGKTASTFIQGLSTIGAAVSGVLLGLTTGSKAYFESRIKEDEAKRTHYFHKDKTYADYLDDARERLMVTAEADQFFKERLINQAKRIRKMSKQLK